MIGTDAIAKRRSFFPSGNVQGEHNFSMAKSEYVPLLTTFDSEEDIFFLRTNTSVQEWEKVNVNRYLPTTNSEFTSSISAYREKKKTFNDIVLDLDKATSYFNVKGFRGFYNRSYKRFPYTRAFRGAPFNMNDRYFSGESKTLLVSKTNDEHTVHYMFTFKPKFLPDLQKALIRGNPLKSHWFTVFMTPEIPEVSNSKGYPKAFKEKFVIPFETAGIEIVYTDMILDQLSYREISVEYSFSFNSKKRDEKALEMITTLKEFQNYEVDKILLQEDWNMGKHSESRFRDWLRTINSTYLMNAFVEYLNETVYASVPLKDGLKRVLQLGDAPKKYEVYDAVAGYWVDIGAFPESYERQVNPLTMYFTGFRHLNEAVLPIVKEDIFEACDLEIQYELYEGIVPYNEVDVVYDIRDDSYYHINNFRVDLIPFTTVLPNIPPPIIIFREGNKYYFDAVLGAYVNGKDTLEMENSDFYHFPLYITTLAEFLLDNQIVPADAIVYFWDIRVLFYREKGFLCKFSISYVEQMKTFILNQIEAATFVTSSNYVEENIKNMLRTLNGSMLLSDQGRALASYYNLAPLPEVDFTSTGETSSLNFDVLSSGETGSDGPIPIEENDIDRGISTALERDRRAAAEEIVRQEEERMEANADAYHEAEAAVIEREGRRDITADSLRASLRESLEEVEPEISFNVNIVENTETVEDDQMEREQDSPPDEPISDEPDDSIFDVEAFSEEDES